MTGPDVPDLFAAPDQLNAWAETVDAMFRPAQAAALALTATVADSLNAATVDAVAMFQPVQDAAQSLLDSLNSEWPRIDHALTAQVEAWAEAVDRSTLDMALAIAAGDVDQDMLPDCSRTPRARCAMRAARIMARRATRAHSAAGHPGSTNPDRDRAEARRLARITWGLWAAACRIADTDPGRAAHLIRLADLLSDLSRHPIADVPHQAHRHAWTVRNLAPPGRRCVALHVSAQAPPATRSGVGCRWRVIARPRSLGAVLTYRKG